MLKIIFSALLIGGTGLAWVGSAYGWGLTGMMKKPVSIRQGSADRGGLRGPYLLYFGSRSHSGGGYRGGK